MDIRNSIKIVLLNQSNQLLLIGIDDKNITESSGKYNGKFWQLIGGKIEENETLEQAMQRELFEETSLTEKEVTFGPIIWHGALDLIMHGVPTHITQKFILAKTEAKSVGLSHLTAEEKSVVKELRWFSIDEIENSDEIIYPALLPKYLRPILDGNIPEKSIEIDLSSKK